MWVGDLISQSQQSLVLVSVCLWFVPLETIYQTTLTSFCQVLAGKQDVTRCAPALPFPADIDIQGKQDVFPRDHKITLVAPAHLADVT